MTPTATPKQALRLSVASSKQNQQFSALTKAYKALSMTDKTSWITLVNSVNISANRTGRHKLSAANLYTKVNTVRLACGQSQLSTAPQSVTPATQLPQTLRLTASTQSGFTCNIITTEAYPGYVQITAPPVAPAGYNTYNKKAFRVLGTLGGLAQGTTSAAALYAAKYGTPPPGAEIVLDLIPMNDLGERLPGRIITAIVPAAASSDNGSDNAPEGDLLRAA